MMTLTEALLKWMASSFNLPHLRNVDNGVICAQILNTIDNHHFNSKWVATVKDDIPAENIRLKSNNIKKVLKGILEYYSDVLGLQLNDFPKPDVFKIAEGNPDDTGRLLQLILGCAVNCEQKHRYIESIMGMEESIQQVIMQAIQELMSVQTTMNQGPIETASSLQGIDVKKIMEELNEANREREDLKQKCHDLENSLNLIEEEKSNLATENDKLQRQLSGANAHNKSDSGMINIEMRKQLENLQEELYKSENQRDELHVKIEVLEKDAEEALAKEAELQKLADQALRLKDELDIMRETADKATKYEAIIESYKKKLEDLGDLKRQVKILEEKNTDYMQKNMELEENIKKSGSWKPQIDSYKKQIAELRAKVDSETKKSDRLEFETKKLIEKVEHLSEDRDRLQHERDELKVENVELKDDINFGEVTKTTTGPGGFDNDEIANLEMIPPAIKERLLRLQHENKRLKASKSSEGNSDESSDVLHNIIDDLKDREKSLESENRKANQKIMELESRLEENTAPPRVPGSREELELKLAEKDKKISQLEDVIQQNESKIHVMEERYKKHIEKAKSVINAFEPKSSGQAGSNPEVNALKSRLTEKDRLIENMEQESDKARAVREMEERLISSAFYNLSMQMHRSAVESRLGGTNTGSSSNKESFLAKQRQVTSSRGNKSGYGSSDFLEY